MKNFKLFLLAMCLWVSNVFGQKYFFKQEYAPNSEYEMTSKVLVKMITNSEIDIYLEKEYHLSLNEEERNKTPFILKYSTKDMSVKLNGKDAPKKSNPISNIKLSGEIINGNQINVVKIYDLKPSLHHLVKGNMSLFSLIKVDFPKNGIEIGETFEQNVLLQVPIQNREINASMTYRLVNVINNVAFFDIEKITIDKSFVGNVDVKWKGNAEFNIEKGYFSKVEIDIEMSSDNETGKINEVIYQKKLK